MTNSPNSKILKNQLNTQKIRELIEKKVNDIKGYTPRVAVFGVTGVGKSSLCNALFGKDLAKVSDVAACTRSTQEFNISSNDSEPGLILIDVPGVGETIERDEEYFKLYSKLIPSLDLVIWVIKADDRAYAIAEKAYKEILKPNLDQCPVIFVINQVDKIEPILDESTGMGFWDVEKNQPKPEKELNINKKINEISKAFGVSTQYIQTASATRNYNIVETMEKIIEILPNGKKYSLYREASQNIKTEKMEDAAEKGIWDSIKDWAGDAWDTVKDIAVEVAKSTIKNFGKKVLKWLSRL